MSSDWEPLPLAELTEIEPSLFDFQTLRPVPADPEPTQYVLIPAQITTTQPRIRELAQTIVIHSLSYIPKPWIYAASSHLEKHYLFEQFGISYATFMNG